MDFFNVHLNKSLKKECQQDFCNNIMRSFYRIDNDKCEISTKQTIEI